jgi:hypothetical protein
MSAPFRAYEPDQLLLFPPNVKEVKNASLISDAVNRDVESGFHSAPQRLCGG